MPQRVFDSGEIDKMLQGIAQRVDQQNPTGDLALIGIRTRGVVLAHRIQKILEGIRPRSIEFGTLDITLYRDDLNLRSLQPVVHSTEIDFDVTQKTVVLVDDVLFTGRTIRAALDALLDYGRPKAIRLAVLIDRGHRELPIQADFCGAHIETALEDRVKVMLTETDQEDCIYKKVVDK